MENQEEIFRRYLLRYPRIEPCLRRLCLGISRREDLRGTVGLGSSFARGEDYEPLLELFGRPALSLSRKGDMRLSLERVSPASGQETRGAWSRALHLALGLPAVNLSLRKKEAAAACATLLDRFRLVYPDLALIHADLRERSEYWTRSLLTGNAEALKAFWFRAADITRFLTANREAMTLADLGARMCGDSKSLKTGKLLGLVVEWLLLLEGGVTGKDAPADKWQILARYHVVENPSAIKVTLFGPVVLWKGGQRLDFVHQFWSQGESATLSWENLSGVERLEIPWPESSGSALSCENESPFRRLKQDGYSGVLVYSQGFPNAAVLRIWELLGRAGSVGTFLHWGDSDLAGLRIAAILNKVQALRLFRCDHRELRRHAPFLKPLGMAEKAAAVRFLEAHPDFPFSAELEFTAEFGWLEQERWSADSIRG
ncbi:MAG: DUF2399 domain-containing protein [Fibrobacteria bacterium]